MIPSYCTVRAAEAEAGLSGIRIRYFCRELLLTLWEDLKGNIMALALRLQKLSETLAPGAVKEELGRLREAVADYTRSMNAKEVMNHLLSLNGRPFHFEVPLAFGGQTRTLDLYYEQLQQQTGKAQERGSGVIGWSCFSMFHPWG